MRSVLLLLLVCTGLNALPPRSPHEYDKVIAIRAGEPTLLEVSRKKHYRLSSDFLFEVMSVDIERVICKEGYHCRLSSTCNETRSYQIYNRQGEEPIRIGIDIQSIECHWYEKWWGILLICFSSPVIVMMIGTSLCGVMAYFIPFSEKNVTPGDTASESPDV